MLQIFQLIILSFVGKKEDNETESNNQPEVNVIENDNSDESLPF